MRRTRQAPNGIDPWLQSTASYQLHALGQHETNIRPSTAALGGSPSVAKLGLGSSRSAVELLRRPASSPSLALAASMSSESIPLMAPTLTASPSRAWSSADSSVSRAPHAPSEPVPWPVAAAHSSVSGPAPATTLTLLTAHRSPHPHAQKGPRPSQGLHSRPAPWARVPSRGLPHSIGCAPCRGLEYHPRDVERPALGLLRRSHRPSHSHLTCHRGAVAYQARRAAIILGGPFAIVLGGLFVLAPRIPIFGRAADGAPACRNTARRQHCGARGLPRLAHAKPLVICAAPSVARPLPFTIAPAGVSRYASP